MAEAAIQGGFRYLGLSEHLPFDDWPPYQSRPRMEEIDDYLTECERLKKKYAGSLKIYTGFETEYFSDQKDYLRAIRSRVDFLLLGQHTYFRGKEECWKEPYCQPQPFVLLADQMIAGMESGLFRYLAHPDYFLLGGTELTEAHLKQIRRIARCAKKNQIVVEINLKGTRRGKQKYGEIDTWRYPNYRIFEIFAGEGCSVCFGYDAHSPKMLIEREIEEQVKKEFSGLRLKYVDCLDWLME